MQTRRYLQPLTLLSFLLAAVVIAGGPTRAAPDALTWQIRTLDSAGDVGMEVSLAVVNGRPAISYYEDRDETARFIWALDANGDAWGEAETLTAQYRGGWGSLVEVAGRPALAYYNTGLRDLMYAIADTPPTPTATATATCTATPTVTRTPTRTPTATATPRRRIYLPLTLRR